MRLILEIIPLSHLWECSNWFKKIYIYIKLCMHIYIFIICSWRFWRSGRVPVFILVRILTLASFCCEK
uniref:Ovule protein n=1 Tax=Heterorhabditis bacteriophora TaxID=37862 RepID=A0A1I7WWQ9_HETBA